MSVVTASAGCAAGTTRTTIEIAGGGHCIYTGHLIDQLESFAAAVGRPFMCAMVFNNAAPTWDDLVEPWFLDHPDGNRNWADWTRAEPGRQLIISQAMVPDDAPADWRARGAAGDFDRHARTLAANLVAAGLGDSVIRLSHESNGPWTKDGLGPDASQYEVWRTAWRNFAEAMRSVPGADFAFDWTVNPGLRPVDFDEYYPGDDVVDVIGVDIYDFWEEARLGDPPSDPDERWEVRFDEPAGVGDLLTFAAARGKPVSVPEWGLSSPGFQGGIGDNPSFVEHVAELVDAHDVSYHAYFAKSPATLVVDAPRSFEVFRDAFGAANGVDDASIVQVAGSPVTTPAPQARRAREASPWN